MSAREQQHACRLIAADATNESNNNNGEDTDDEPITIKCDAPDCYMSSTEEDNVAANAKPLRQRKRSTSNLLYRPSKAFSDSHEESPPSLVHPSKIRHCASPVVNVTPIVGHRDGLRKQLLVRRSPSPSSFSGHRQRLDLSPANNGSICASPGYMQYQMALLEVPMPRDYGDASSDDLSSEWDSDVPEPHRSPKVNFNHLFPMLSHPPTKKKKKPNPSRRPKQTHRFASWPKYTVIRKVRPCAVTDTAHTARVECMKSFAQRAKIMLRMT